MKDYITNADCWRVLGIEPTSDERTIMRAYAKLLKTCRPDEDPEGFQTLVEARSDALTLAPLLAAEEAEEEASADVVEAAKGDPVAQEPPTEIKNGMPDDSAEPVTTPEQEQSATQAFDDTQLFIKVMQQLASLLTKVNSERGKDYDLAAWESLFNKATGLSLDETRRFHMAIAIEMERLLPKQSAVADNDVSRLQGGIGVLAFVELIERECHFGWNGAVLQELVGTKSALLYDFWLSRAQSARALLTRLATIDTAYQARENGLPDFDDEDQAIIFARKEFQEYRELALSAKKKPFAPDWLTILLPVRRLFYYNQTWLALIFLGAEFAAVNTVVRYADAGVMVHIAVYAAFFALNFLMAMHIKPWTLSRIARRVRTLDKRHLLGPQRRAALSFVNTRASMHFYLSIIELCFLIAVVASIYSSLHTQVERQKFASAPSEEIISEYILTLLESTARNDEVSSRTFFSLLNETISLRDEFEKLQISHKEETKDGLPPSTRFMILSQSIRDYRTRSEFILVPLVSLKVERARKLDAIAKLYRNASSEEKRRYERQLLSWRDLILSDSYSFDDEVAKWTMIEIGDVKGSIIANPDAIMRNQLLKRLFYGANQRAQKRMDIDSAAFVKTLSRLLDAPEADLRKEFFRDRPFQDTYDVLRTPGPEESENNDEGAIIEWNLFAGATHECLVLSDDEDKDALYEAIRAWIKRTPQDQMQDELSVWRGLASAVMTVPACRNFMAGTMQTVNGFDKDVSLIDLRLKHLINNNNSEQAMALAQSVEGWNHADGQPGKPVSRAVIFQASQRLKEGKPSLAIEHIQKLPSQKSSCARRAFRGYVLMAAGADVAAEEELSAAILAHVKSGTCISEEDGLNYLMIEVTRDHAALVDKLAKH